MLRNYSRFIIGLGALLLFLGLMLIVGAATVDRPGRTQRIADGRDVTVGVSWPGEFDSCVTDPSQAVLPNCYREPVAAGSLIKQPLSTVSALAYSLIGLAILWWVGWETANARGSGALERMYVVWFGFVALAMGPGSMLFHGTLTAWGGWFDQLSMYLLLGFMAAYNVARATGAQKPIFVLAYIAFVVLGGLAALTGSLFPFVAAGVLVGVLEVVSYFYLLPRKRVLRSGGRLLAAFIVLALAFVPWVGSNAAVGSPTSFPFHMFWHIVSALFVGVYYFYLRSERQVDVAGSPVGVAA